MTLPIWAAQGKGLDLRHTPVQGGLTPEGSQLYSGILLLACISMDRCTWPLSMPHAHTDPVGGTGSSSYV